MSQVRVLVSACLLGEKVRYDGGVCTVESQILKGWVEEGIAIPFCPELAGGLAVPRPPAEIQGAGGHAILDGDGFVRTRGGQDVTPAFLIGARSALEVAQAANVQIAILKESSPSCGRHQIHDGHFAGARVPGQGVTAALLMRSGIAVFNEDEIEAAAGLLTQLR